MRSRKLIVNEVSLLKKLDRQRCIFQLTFPLLKLWFIILIATQMPPTKRRRKKRKSLRKSAKRTPFSQTQLRRVATTTDKILRKWTCLVSFDNLSVEQQLILFSFSRHRPESNVPTILQLQFRQRRWRFQRWKQFQLPFRLNLKFVRVIVSRQSSLMRCFFTKWERIEAMRRMFR